MPQNERVHICGLTPFLRVGFTPHWSKQNYDAVCTPRERTDID
jgi:hypothetical protein